jgi:hypothetical protein
MPAFYESFLWITQTFPFRNPDLHHGLLGIHSRMGLGFSSMATMVVLYRNAPNTTPLVIRGNLDQRSFVGIFPRTTDLPAGE